MSGIYQIVGMESQRASRRSRVYSSRREKRTGLALPFYLVFVAFGREGVDVLMQ